jgi:hypothetical protein
MLPAAPSGAVKGYVKDVSNAVVPGAALTLTGNDNGLTQRAPANRDGYFQFLQVAPGRYQLTAEAAGFRKATVREVVVLVGQIVSLDVHLEVGHLTEVVEVTEHIAPLIEPEKSSTGIVFDVAMVQNLPVPGRQFLDLAVLAPGVTLQAPGTLTGGFAAAGQRTQSNQFLLDGISNVDPQVNGPLNSFRIADAVQEFSVSTTAAPAEYGRVSGAQVHIVTRSGSNQLHGSAFWLHRNDALEARDFFTNKFGGSKRVLRRHQYGASAGGPVRRDQAFFFYSWERFRQKNPTPATAVVPTAAQRASVLDPIARNLLEYWPLPTDPSAAPGRTNFVGNTPQSTFDNTHLARLDHAWSPRDRLTGRYVWTGGENTVGGAIPTTGARDGRPSSQSLLISEVHTFSPTWLAELRAGLTRNTTDFTAQDRGLNAAPLFPGVPGVVDGSRDPENSGLPFVFVAGYASLGTATNVPQGRTTNTYELAAAATKIAPLGFSRHTMRFGFQGRREEMRRYNNATMRGQLVFASFADFAGTCAACGGRSLLNSSTIRTGSTLGHWYRYAWAFWMQDDVRLKRNLTLNWGLRYELPSAMVEKNDRGTNFVEGVGPMLVGTTRILDLDPARPGPAGFFYREAPFTLPRGGYNPDRNNLAPVAGFAYSPNSRTVLRGGFRVSYDEMFHNVPVNQTLNAPWSITTTQRAGTTQPATGYRWEQAFNQNVPLVARTPASQGPGTPAVGLITFTAYDRDAPSPYSYNWNFGVQRELSRGASVEVSYLGSAGHKLAVNVDANEPQVLIRNAGFRGPQAPNEQLFPYPQWSGISLTTFQSNSIYHGLAASWRWRQGQWLNSGGSYTFGHGIDNNSAIFGSDDDAGRPNTRRRLDLERSHSANDQRHRFIAWWVADLPGRGWLLGGWQVSGIANVFSGQPFTVFANQTRDFSGFNQLNDRPDVAGPGPLTLRRGDSDNFFDPAYFGKAGTGVCPGYAAASGNTVANGCAPAGHTGTSPRNGYYGPGVINFDLSVSRKFTVGERMALRARADFFNLPNHTNFGVRTGNRSMNSGEFGKLTTVSEYLYGGPRVIQLGLRLEF